MIAHLVAMVAATAAGIVTAVDAVAQGDGPVPVEVTAQLDRLRTHWPEVAQAEMRGGQRFEFRDGSIRVGADTLRDLASDPANVNGAVLTFLLAHEGWHAVQHARRTEVQIRQMKDNRMLECEADFMGAAAAYRDLAGRSLSSEALAVARRAIQSYVRAHSTGFGGAAAYPDPDMRSATIAIGWAQAGTPDLFRAGHGEAVPTIPEDARATDVCARIAHGGDSSLGVIEMTWANVSLVDDGATRRFRRLSISNKSPRRVTVRFLAPSRYAPRREGDARPNIDNQEIFSVLDVSVTISGRSSEVLFLYLPNHPDVRAGDYHWTELPRLSGSRPRFATSNYAESEPPVSYCFEQAARATRPSDRATLVRIGSIALAAEDDFRPIMGWESYDSEFQNRRIAIMAALNPTGDDIISEGGNAEAITTVFQSESEEAVRAEFTRLKQLLSDLCGAGAVTEVIPSDEPAILIRQFAPHSSVRMTTGMFSNYYARQIDAVPESARLRGGRIFFVVARDGAN